jgi:hypothetical protein
MGGDGGEGECRLNETREPVERAGWLEEEWLKKSG